MATVPTRFDHKVKVKGTWRPSVAIWVKVKGTWRPVTNGWSRVSGAWRPWVHTSGGGGQPPVHPPTTTHLATVHAHVVPHLKAVWTIPAGRHVLTQTLTYYTGTHTHPQKHTATPAASARSHTVLANSWNLSVRYRYT